MPNDRPTLEALRVKFEKLDAKLEESDEDHPLGRRLRRSLSWLERADSGEFDDDVRYIFLWVAFNAAYADDRDRDFDERRRYKEYFKKLTEKENNKYRIHNVLRYELMDSCFSLVGNKYVFTKFWNFLDKGRFIEDDWKKSQEGKSFEYDYKKVRKFLISYERLGPMPAALQKAGFASREDTTRILDILFQRLYVLRNQIMHGSATSHMWSDPSRSESRGRSTSTEVSSLNRSQVGDGVRVLEFLVPLFLDIMMDHPEMDREEYWGKLPYPVRSDIREDRCGTRR